MTLVRLVTCMLSPNVPRSEPLSHVTSLAVFLMGALALVVPSGYSVGPVLLLLASTALLFKRFKCFKCFKCSSFVLLPQDRWIIVALVAYGLVVGVMSAVELGSRGFDRPLRFLLAIPVLLLILRYPPRLSWLWGGVALGAIGAGSLALWLKLVEGVARASGFLHAIQFGNLSMLMGVLCFAGLGWAVVQRQRHAWVSLLLLGALLGMLGSLMSGSRGGWVGLPVVGYVLYRGYGRQLPMAIKA
ncbi:MAG: ligase, partial [Pseudomonadota bacterium]|nr:ligase [Pseudomonadota bacterium]